MKLKSCPFCGQEGAGAHWDHGYWSVTCGYRHDGAPGAHCFQDWGEVETEEEAIEAWNRRAEAPNPPLTLEELRQMDGEPVWVEWSEQGEGCWALIKEEWKNGLSMTTCGAFDLYGKVWRAYRRRPEEEK